jgi:hypothetical protein
MLKKIIFFAISLWLMSLNISSAQVFDDEMGGLNQLNLSLVNWNGQKSLRLIFEQEILRRDFFGQDNLSLTLSAHNFFRSPFSTSNMLFWSEIGLTQGKFSYHFKTLHNFPSQWEFVWGRTLNQLKVDYNYSSALKLVGLYQRTGFNHDLLKFYLNYEIPRTPITLDAGFYSSMDINHNQPACFVRLRYDFLKLGSFGFSNIFERHKSNDYLNKMVREVKSETSPNQPIHNFIVF